MALTSIERPYASATLYRFLSLAFSQPSAADHEALLAALPAANLATSLSGSPVADALLSVAADLEKLSWEQLADEHRRIFTLSASPDCPLNECAYSARHVYQEVQALADLSGFYRAFCVEPNRSRPDELAAELEFCYLVSLKQGLAGERSRPDQARICRDGLRSFLRDHLGRWAENVGLRLQTLYPGSPYAGYARLLVAFMDAEIRRLKPGTISPHEPIPHVIQPLEEEGCPALDNAASRFIGGPASDPETAVPQARLAGERQSS